MVSAFGEEPADLDVGQGAFAVAGSAPIPLVDHVRGVLGGGHLDDQDAKGLVGRVRDGRDVNVQRRLHQGGYGDLADPIPKGAAFDAGHGAAVVGTDDKQTPADAERGQVAGQFEVGRLSCSDVLLQLDPLGLVEEPRGGRRDDLAPARQFEPRLMGSAVEDIHDASVIEASPGLRLDAQLAPPERRTRIGVNRDPMQWDAG